MKRENSVNIRFSDKEYERLQELQKELGYKTLAKMIRNTMNTILDHPQLKFIYDMPSSEQLDLENLDHRCALLEQAVIILNQLHNEGMMRGCVQRKAQSDTDD